MTSPAAIDRQSRPRLAAHVRLTLDRRRDRWVVLAPERMLVPDEIALDILRRCTGETAVDDMISALAKDYDAPRDDIAADVLGLLGDLSEKGVIVP